MPLCVDAEGFPVLCNRQLDELRESYAFVLKMCNDDKAAIATLPLKPEDGSGQD